MQQKSVLPFAFVLGIAAVWTMLTRGGGDVTRPVTTLPQRNVSQTKTTVTVQSDAAPANGARDEVQEKHLETILMKKNSVKVHSIVCAAQSCAIDATPQGDPVAFQNEMQNLLVENPGLGTHMERIPAPENAERQTFVIRRPTPPSVD